MATLYYYATLHRSIVVGTGNKVEDFGVGFYTKYGDGGVDISPIADLMKSEVFAIAKELNIIESIQKAKPTDGLWKMIVQTKIKLVLPMMNWNGLWVCIKITPQMTLKDVNVKFLKSIINLIVQHNTK